MSSLVRPVGPDGPRTYWARRIVVLMAVLIVVALLMWILWPKGGDPVATVPSTPQTPTTTPESPSPESPSPEPTPSPTAQDTTTAQPETPAASTSPTPEQTPAAPPETTRAPTPTPTPTPTAAAACKPEDLRVTLTGPPTVNAGKAVTFELSVINGGQAPCALTINADNLELKVYSGTDRIWTTNHCTDWVPNLTDELAPEKATTWSMAWPAKRSAGECTIRDDVLRPGTYVATAQLDGAKPVQHVMRLR